MPAPLLVPIAPTQGDAVSVDPTPFWIGSASSSQLRVYLPGIADRHASISERQDGYYLSPFSANTAIRVNGTPIATPTRLDDAMVIELGPAARYEYVTGTPRAKPLEPSNEPVYSAPEKRGSWFRRRRGARSARVGFPLWMWAAALLIVAALGFGGLVLYRMLASGPTEESGPPPLTEVEARLFDSLMVVSTTQIERGATLLDLGLEAEALRELAGAITGFEASPLARNPWVEERVAVLTETVIKLYRANRLTVPSGIKASRSRIPDLSRSLSANLTADQFSAAVTTVQRAFEAQYRREFAVTGRDHPEHLSLYGAGSAIDVRVKDLTDEQIQFLIVGFGRTGIRVKDFSRDAILQAQIKAALARGWTDRAGTGRHLHIDRFRDRRDRYTVPVAGMPRREAAPGSRPG